MQLSSITLILSLGSAGLAAASASNGLSVALLRRANDRGFEFTSACIQKSDDFFSSCESSKQAAGQSTRPCFDQGHQFIVDCLNS
ncbi:hypothetical protein ISF_09501 [Cordyceps fumosorosea ARSEF 2679]|uniref:Uncharacterized protein n=1 Tax=Cordyceps fumosorosea (strain ARSEF 2679) TaxID=1081104 RepID=A0A167HJ36_CORFA|nr:hypothetical protein ISF_09501 [Cordyceps fumosorosea ARSEF 2679]OAA47969.1 hypothetical protein ISF_09501 [Cordyceps fumosorosea ARSEF 2679]